MIQLRINGKVFNEAFNKMMDLDLNLVLYLVKFFKFDPVKAARSVYFKEFCLFHPRYEQVLFQVDALKKIFPDDVLDLVFK